MSYSAMTSWAAHRIIGWMTSSLPGNSTRRHLLEAKLDTLMDMEGPGTTKPRNRLVLAFNDVARIYGVSWSTMKHFVASRSLAVR